MMSSKPVRWKPMDILNEKSEQKIVLIQLNVPFQIDILQVLWNKAVLKLATDGAVNRLYSCTEMNTEKYTPDIVSGDLDSAHKHLIEYYRQKGSEIIQTPDQDETDFTKGLKIVLERIQRHNLQVDALVSYDDVSGRLDHIFANFNTMYTAKTLTDLPLYSVVENSISVLLEPGEHEIDVSSPLRGDWCSLVPIGHRCDHVTTTGLKWNLDGDSMEFGGLVSTSNTFTDADTVTVHTDKHLLWTMARKTE